MNHYWLNHYETSAAEFGSQPLKQVGKTVNGVDVSFEQVKLIVDNIARVLELNASDTLVDLCCGNGVLTTQLARISGMVIGVDFSSGLLDAARSDSASKNIKYLQMDVTDLSETIIDRASKYSMYEAMQHLSPEDFDRLLSRIGGRCGAIKLLVGGVPDLNCLRCFYITDKDYRFYQQREKSGTPHLGRWWTKDEMAQAAARNGYIVKIIPQPPGLYTSHYRFDALFERVA
jgi:SAM-dependent methyltransferase